MIETKVRELDQPDSKMIEGQCDDLLVALKDLVTAYEEDVVEDKDMLCAGCGHTSSSHVEDYCMCGECVEYISPTLALENAQSFFVEVPA